MYLPKWFNALFSSTKEEAIPDTSTNLNKIANQSELVQNLLSDKPVEKAADHLKCPACHMAVSPEAYPFCSSCREKERAKTQATEAPKVSLMAELEKEAGAYEMGDTEEMTANKSHESQIKAASNFALAEMLTEFRLKGQGVQENWHLEFPKCLGEVQKNRKKAEKELLKFTPCPAVIHRMQFLAETMEDSHDKGFEHTEAENLYKPLFEYEGKQTWEKSKDKWEDEPISAKEQYENQMPEEGGPGREEKDQMEHQAPRSAVANLTPPDELQLIPQDKFLVHYTKVDGGERYFKWLNTEEAAKHYMDDIKKEEFALEPKMKDFSKEFAVKEGETLAKKADISSPWTVITQEDKEVIARITPEEVLKKSKEKVQNNVGKKASLDINKLAERILAEIETKAALALTSKEDTPEPAESLEGLEPHEQELWKKHYKLALQWATADPIARKIGRSEARRAAMVALLRVIRKYNPQHESKAKFESYLYSAVHNELLTALSQSRTLRDKDPEKFVSLEQPIQEGDKMYESETLQDIIEDTQQKLPEEELEQSEQAAIAREVLQKAQSVLQGKDKEVFDLLLQGYNISQIAGMMHFTIPNIVRYRKKIADALEKIMKEVMKAPPRPSSPEPKKDQQEAEAGKTAATTTKAWQALTNVKLEIAD